MSGTFNRVNINKDLSDHNDSIKQNDHTQCKLEWVTL